jgi:hypothetical protein
MTDTVDSPDPTAFVRYRDDLERPRPDEDQLVKKIADVLHGNNEWAFKKYRHGIRDAHAKSHGILRGELTVYSGLREPYRQGLFAAPATYPVIARLSSTSGALRSDQTRGVRGLGIKVLGVDGPRSRPDDDATTQDFIWSRTASSRLPTRRPTSSAVCRWRGCWPGCRTALFFSPATHSARPRVRSSA